MWRATGRRIGAAQYAGPEVLAPWAPLRGVSRHPCRTTWNARFEALEPPRQAVREARGDFAEDIAAGTKLRHHHGSRCISHAHQDEVRFLGLESGASFVREPEGNGCA